MSRAWAERLAWLLLALAAGFMGGFAGSALHPGPPGPKGEAASAAGCWSYEIPNRTTSNTTICLVSRP